MREGEELKVERGVGIAEQRAREHGGERRHVDIDAPNRQRQVVAAQRLPQHRLLSEQLCVLFALHKHGVGPAHGWGSEAAVTAMRVVKSNTEQQDASEPVAS